MSEQWFQIIAIILIFFCLSNRVHDELKGIREEMKDFHERLIKIEMDRK